MAAGLGFKTFTTGEVLTAGDVNGYLMQGINVFADAAARTAAITSPQEGQYSYLKDSNSLWYYSGSAWVAAGGSPLTTKGDLYGYSTTDTRVPVGANNTVLTADSAEASGVKWAVPASGGMTVLASGTLSGASLSLTGIAGTYRDLVLQILNPSSVSGGGGGIEYSINSVGSYLGVFLSSTTTTVANVSGSLQIPVTIPSAANTYQFHEFTCTNYASTTSRKTGSFVASASAGDLFGDWSGASPTAAVTSITVITGGAGNWDAGTYVLYGVS